MKLFVGLAFIYSQIIFLPSYIKCTKLLIRNEKLSLLELVKYILLSPLSAYILSGTIVSLIYLKFSWVEMIGADLGLYIVSFVYLLIYQRSVTKKGNKVLAIYMYVSFFLLQTTFTYIFANIWFVLLELILLPTILSIAVYKIAEKYIKPINQRELGMTLENKAILVIPFSTSIIRLTQSISWFLFSGSGKYGEELVELFSAYNALIGNLILILAVYFTMIMFHSVARQVQLSSAAKKYQKLSEQSLHAMVKAIEAKDVYTKGHSIRVAEYSEMIAKKLGYSDDDAKQIYMMALVHDVGKIGIPDTIINKAGRLTETEYTEIKRHSEIGAEILQEVDGFKKMSEIALEHHEREDGKGYPKGLKGNEISEEAAIVSVADAYDAMTSRRSYRDVMPQEAVLAEIEREIGKQFKKRPAEAMIEILKEDKNFELRQK